jgi:neurotransmitter:Na+ symporter, NSS family
MSSLAIIINLRGVIMGIQKEQWGSRLGLILAMAGNAVGLGNFLRFPAQAVQNGGGAFIIPYIVSFVLMGIPLLWIEWSMGRFGGQFGHHSAPGMLKELGKQRWLKYFGIFGIFTNLAIMSYYAYIESWTLGYAWHSISGTFSGMDMHQVSSYFDSYLGTTKGGIISFSNQAILFFVITLALNIWVLSRGINKGIEMAGKIAMPLLFVFAILLTIRALTLDAGENGAINNASVGLNFLWHPNFDSLYNPKVWLAAAGQVFFTLSVGMGCIQCYAAYLKKNQDIALNSLTAGFTNEFVEIVLGASIIVPIAVSYLGLDWIKANVGFEMGFRTMPTLFQNWGPILATIAGLSWFGLLFFAGVTSSLAMGQPVMAFMEDNFKIKRGHSALILGGLVLLLSAPAVLFYGSGAFGEYDYWAGTFSLVVFALGETIIFVWIFGPEKSWKEINRGAEIKIPSFFKFIIKYVTPVFLIAVFIGSAIKPEGGEWGKAISMLSYGDGWPLACDSLVGMICNLGINDTRWFIDGKPSVIFIKDATRILLLTVFIGVGIAIHVAFNKKITKRRKRTK